MALKNPDISEHNNPDMAQVDADFVRGGTRTPVANLTALYALASKSDQLKEYSTRVFVIAPGKFYTLINLANVGNASGWLADGTSGGLSVERQVATIAARNALGPGSTPPLLDQEDVYVVDATGDPTVTSGWAIYKWLQGVSAWLKIQEQEGIDVDFTVYARKDGTTFTGPVNVLTAPAGDKSLKAVNTTHLQAALKLDGLDPYDPAVVYNASSAPVTNGTRIWQYINLTPAAGQTPAENAYWTEVSANVSFATQPELTAETLKTKAVSPWGLGQWFANKVLTGLVAGTNAAIAATDTIMIALAKLQAQINNKLNSALANGSIFIGSAGGVATAQPVTGDATIANTGVLTIGANKVTNSKLAQMANLTVKGNNTGATADPVDMPMVNLWEGVQGQFWDNERGLDRWARGTVFKQLSDGTVANTAVKTSLVNVTNQVGVNVLPAGAMFVGDSWLFEMSGIFSVANGVDSLALEISLGTLVIASIPATVFGTVSNVGFYIRVNFTVRSQGATGTITAFGNATMDDMSFQMVNTAVLTLDTTASKTVDVKATWSAANAANSITAQQAKLTIE